MTFGFNVEKTSCVFSNHKVFTRLVCLDYSADRTETTWKWQEKASSNFHVWASACVCIYRVPTCYTEQRGVNSAIKAPTVLSNAESRDEL